MLQTAIEAARKASRVIVERYPAERNVTFKGYRDIVTEVDVSAEAIVLGMIRERFPGHAIVSEEAEGGAVGDKLSRGHTWVVDPLDGTTNYARRIPVFCVSIGVLERGEPCVAVVHDPLRDQTFVAERGWGSRLDGALMHVSRVADFGSTVVGMDWARDDAGRQRVLACLGQIAPRCGTARVLGSAALGLAYVAAGWLDAYVHLALKPWDAAAGMLLVAEAGGRCTTLDGAPYRVDSPGCVATNGLIHEELLALIGDFVS
jgi:myo-inositol-1(or 4)-monophosphatase